MKIKAKFKGRDGREGYNNGQKYSLKFQMHTNLRGGKVIIIHNIIGKSDGSDLTTLRKDSAVCYLSLRKFLDNWEVL